ncbi:MAG TPA: biotin carboxylase N-terminal domain-containing protein [Solirubrobacterales bacterium]|nr:biotin carboxylase N-terminal domain-containing protein [Solirubrobacterales bacterium]
MFSRVLIANRGEIARRVERTLRRLGVESVAVYSDADAGAPHVREADHAVHIGPTAAAESYLRVERIVEAARRSGAEAVHPGYGFLSESPALARACAEAGLVFVGPPPEAIELLGDKAAAKRTAAAAGVPVLPGIGGEGGGDRLGDEEIVAWAAGDGELPLMLKAAAGGGGKGMRVVESLEALPAAIEAARREAQAAFGDDRLLAERYVPRSRHIEVQVLADAHGNAVHLGERECSLQRRHQKVIEESPSPVVGPELRQRMGEAAVALAQASGYVNAGTVELIAERDDPGSFYFLEVNTRLQVEHPVTELVTGLDLVEQQLRVAAGEPLGFAQADVELRGHAVEARVYAEDPANGFLPSAGKVVAYREPRDAGGPIRVDSGVEEGVEVGTDYDPLLTKVIAHAPDRAEALARLERGLRDLVILGPTTNSAYLRALLSRPEVREGAIDTGLIERLGDAIAPPPHAPELPAVALALLLSPRSPAADPWDATDAWRPTGPGTIRVALAGPAAEGVVELCAAMRNEAQPHPGEWLWKVGEDEGSFALAGDLVTVDGISRRLGVYCEGDAVWILDGAAEPARFAFAAEAGAAAGAAPRGSLEAPMPGTVIDVRAAAGAAVEEGEVLVLLESMKMELSVQSPRDGLVAEVLVAKGEQVERGQALVALDGDGEGETA